MEEGEELSEQKKAELRRIADITFEGIVAAARQIEKLKAEHASQAPEN